MATGIPIDDLVKLPFSLENNCNDAVFPLVYGNGGTYKAAVEQIFFNNSIPNGALQVNSVTTEKINDLSITTDKIADQAIQAGKIQNNTITCNQIAACGIGNENMTPRTIQGVILREKTITNSELADNSVSTDKIQNNSIITDKIRDAAVTTDKLNDQSVINDKIANNTIASTKIEFIGDSLTRAPGAILIHNQGKYNSSIMSGDGTLNSTGVFNLNPIPTDKLLDDAVTTPKILDKNITKEKIADKTITSAQIADATITNENMIQRSLQGLILQCNTINNEELADNSVGTRNIQAQSISPTKIQNGTIATKQIASQGILNDSLRDRNIEGRKLKTGTIGTDELADNSVNNAKIDNSGDYTFNSITNTSADVGINGIDYKFPSSLTNDRFLKHSSSGNLEWVTPTEFSPRAPSTVLDKVLPVGSIMSYSANTLPADGKFLPCDGSEQNTDDYPDLSKLIKGIYGTASSASKFVLPDLRGRVPVGYSESDSNFNSVGKTGGRNDISLPSATDGHILTTNEMPSHCHNAGFGASGPHLTEGGTGIYGVTTDDVPGKAKTSDRGGGFGLPKYQTITNNVGGSNSHSHNITFNGSNKNIPKYNTIPYIIKALPDRVVQLDVELGPGLVGKRSNPVSTTSNITLDSTCLNLVVNNNQLCFNNTNQLAISDSFITDLANDGGISITTSTDNTVPTTKAVKNYVDNRPSAFQPTFFCCQGSFSSFSGQYADLQIISGCKSDFTKNFDIFDKSIYTPNASDESLQAAVDLASQCNFNFVILQGIMYKLGPDSGNTDAYVFVRDYDPNGGGTGIATCGAQRFFLGGRASGKGDNVINSTQVFMPLTNNRYFNICSQYLSHGFFDASIQGFA